jgi:hypothetical protein
MSLKSDFLTELNEEIAHTADFRPAVVTEADIAPLPEPVQFFFRNCGYLDREVVFNGLIEYRNVYLKIWEDSSFAPVQVHHFDSVPVPRRGVFLHNNILGFIPLDANVWFKDGEARTKARIMKIFSPSVPKGREQNESALADLLGDTFLIPGFALQPYIHWIAINSLTARAIIRHAGLEVSAIFRFNQAGECIQFDTEDKSFTLKDTTTTKVRNTMHFDDYREHNGLRVPTALRSYWHLATGDFEYAKGEYAGIRHNVREPVNL